MAFLLLAICGFYLLLWLWGLGASLMSKGRKNPFVPIVGVGFFIVLCGITGMAGVNALANPTVLSPDNFNRLSVGMTPEEVAGILGEPLPDADPSAYDLGHFGISVAGVTDNLLRSGTFSEERQAKLTIVIGGEPGRLGKKGTMGAPADQMVADEGGVESAVGLKGLILEFKLSPESDEVIRVVEGENWTLENDMTPQDIAKALGDAINALDQFDAVGNSEEEPSGVIISHALEEMRGDAGNHTSVQNVSGANNSIAVQRRKDGQPAKFSGGADEIKVQLWYELGEVLDADFDTANRLILVGFVDGKLVGKAQYGILAPEELES